MRKDAGGQEGDGIRKGRSSTFRSSFLPQVRGRSIDHGSKAAQREEGAGMINERALTFGAILTKGRRSIVHGSNGGEAGEEIWENRALAFSSRLPTAKGSILHGRIKQRKEQSREESISSRRTGSARSRVSYTGHGLKDEKRRFSSFMRKVSTAKSAGRLKRDKSSSSGRSFGIARQSPRVDAVMR